MKDKLGTRIRETMGKNRPTKVVREVKSIGRKRVDPAPVTT
jgi:hypothetical protein